MGIFANGFMCVGVAIFLLGHIRSGLVLLWFGVWVAAW